MTRRSEFQCKFLNRRGIFRWAYTAFAAYPSEDTAPPGTASQDHKHDGTDFQSTATASKAIRSRQRGILFGLLT
jgi:hypothetical protein